MSDKEFEIEIKNEFLEEAAEICEEVEASILQLETAENHLEIIEKIFRLAHTLKGSGFAAGFDNLAQFTHIFESLLGHMKTGAVSPSSEVVDVLLSSIDTIKTLVNKLTDDHEATLDVVEREDAIKKIIKDHNLAPIEIKPKAGGGGGLELFDDDSDTPDAAEPNSSASKSRSRGRVLICDDDKDVAEGLELIVTEEGFETTCVHSGTAALQTIKESPPDLVLCDLKMPGMDGLEFLGRLTDEDISTPVIMISGFAARDDLVKFFKLGVYDFIEKPFNAGKVATSLSNAIKMSKIRENVLTLSSLNFKAYMAMTRYWSHAETADSDEMKELAERIKNLFEDIASISNSILDI